MVICLEHSFWLAQKGSSFSKSFTDALNLYLKGHHALLNKKLEDYLMSKGGDDWFATRYRPSEKECVKCQKIVFDNLLRKDSVFFVLALLIQHL